MPQCSLAIERDAGLLKLKRAQPAPTGAFLIAKISMAALFAAFAMGSIAVAALCTGQLHLRAVPLLEISSLLIIGSAPFAAIGLCIGAHVRGSAAPGISHLIYLPMLQPDCDPPTRASRMSRFRYESKYDSPREAARATVFHSTWGEST